MTKRILVVAAVAILSGCTGSHVVSSSVPATQSDAARRNAGIVNLGLPPRPSPIPDSIYTPQPADFQVTHEAMPTPFNPSLPLKDLARTELENNVESIASASQRFAQRFATAPPNDHESEGVFLFGNAPPYNALSGTQTAYEAIQRPLPFPSRAVGIEQIFVPTMHPAWGSCLENSSFYISSPAGESAHFTIFNFCEASPSFIFDATINRDFLKEYVRTTDAGLPSYVSEIFTPDAQPSGDSTWYSILYNFMRHRYDIMISARANGFFQGDAFGWSIVEPFAAQGACPSIAPAMVSQLSVHNTITGRWDAVAPSMAGGASSFIGLQAGSTNSCLLGDASGSASMNFNVITSNSAWEVTSPRRSR